MITLLWMGAAPAGAQNPVLEITHQMSITTLQQLTAPYFKTLPYNKSFSSFLREVMSDPDLQDVEVNRRTDSTFFYVSGTYRRYNPFIYRPTTVKVIIAEAEFSDSDTSNYKDTVVYYQLLVTTDSTPQSRQFVEKEYNRLLRKGGRNFSHKTYAPRLENNASEGAITHSFSPPFNVSPLTLAWGREADTRLYAFSLTLLMKVKENRAGMVTLPQESIRTIQ